MTSADMAILRRLRETGAPLVECRAALAALGDEHAARARLRDLAGERIIASVGCTQAQASAAYARFGWDLARASAEARRQMLDADPALAARLRRRWQLEIVRVASRCDHLMSIVYDADLRTPLAQSIRLLAELEGLLDDRSGTDLGHAFDDYPGDMTELLARIDATKLAGASELINLVRGGARDCIGRIRIDFAAADGYLGTLYVHLRDELLRVLEIEES
jgi:hypothetical protein